MPTRVAAVDEDGASEEVKQILAAARKLLGRVPASFAVMCHTPKVARWMLAFIAAIHRDGAGSLVDGRLKNLAVLKTSIMNECSYCIGHNSTYGREFGVDDEALAAIRSGYETSPLFSDTERAVIRWAEVVTRHGSASTSAEWAELRRHLPVEQAVELTLLICHFNAMNRFNKALWLELEPQQEVERIRSTRQLAVADVEAYATSVR